MLFITYTSVKLVTIRVTINGAEAIIKYSPFPFVPVLCFHIKGRFKFIDSGRHCCFSVSLMKSYTTESTRDMGHMHERAEKKADEQGKKTGQIAFHVKLAVVCSLLYRYNSRGTQNTRTSSIDITFYLWNIPRRNGNRNPSKSSAGVRKMARSHRQPFGR